MDISVSTKPQYDKAGGHNVISPSIVGGDSTYSLSTYEGQSVISPSLAEGVRGWVSPISAFQIKSATAIKGSASSLRDSARKRGIVAIHKSIESVVIASERSERGKTRRSRSFFSKTRRSRSFFSNPQKNIDCHENPCGFSRNDGVMDCFSLWLKPLPRNENDELLDCHDLTSSSLAMTNTIPTPQTPYAREGDFKKPSYPHLCAKIYLAILAIITTASINILIALESTKLCAKSIISSHTDFCVKSSTDYLTDFAPRSAIDFANPTKQQNYTDFRNFADSTPYAIPRPKDISAFLWLENWRDTYFLYVYNLTPMRNPQYLRGELKGQISFRAPIIPKFFSQNWIFYLAFTNTFYFQLFNEKASSPMRDNDFQPEFLLTYRHKSRHKGDFVQSDRFSLTEITFGWRHISNGEIDKAQGGVADRSRGSDRFILKARFSNKHWGFDMEAFVPTRFYKENLDIYKYT